MLKICVMAISQISTSKKPIIGARYFMPRDTKIIRIVSNVTSKMRAVKMKAGTIINLNISE